MKYDIHCLIIDTCKYVSWNIKIDRQTDIDNRIFCSIMHATTTYERKSSDSMVSGQPVQNEQDQSWVKTVFQKNASKLQKNV